VATEARRDEPSICWISPFRDGGYAGSTGLGLHGTWSEALSVGGGRGAYPFANADIEEVNVLLPIGSQVYVTE
jgi:hypothetical protein